MLNMCIYIIARRSTCRKGGQDQDAHAAGAACGPHGAAVPFAKTMWTLPEILMLGRGIA